MGDALSKAPTGGRRTSKREGHRPVGANLQGVGELGQHPSRRLVVRTGPAAAPRQKHGGFTPMPSPSVMMTSIKRSCGSTELTGCEARLFGNKPVPSTCVG